MIGQLHVSAVFTPGKEPPILFEEEAVSKDLLNDIEIFMGNKEVGLYVVRYINAIF